MSADGIRIAMWSGPRNISTAMMRAWENRGDCAVSDEPLYAHYLAQTGLEHPGRDAIIADGDTDWRRVVARLTGPPPGGAAIWYQKHMTHHLLPGIGLDWISSLRNVLLIRDPREVVASYLGARTVVSANDIGLPQQVALYEALCATGQPPPVIDAGDFLRAPEAHLRALCAWLGIEFRASMLRWPRGPRASDGIWAPHWYGRVLESTGFDPPRADPPVLEGRAATVADACRPLYLRLHAARLRA